MQPSGYALSATRPKEALWAESALGPAKREPFVNSFIMRMLFRTHPHVTTPTHPPIYPGRGGGGGGLAQSHDKVVKKKRFPQPMSPNVPQPMDNGGCLPSTKLSNPPAHPPTRADTAACWGGYLHLSPNQGKPRQTHPPTLRPPSSV